MSKQKEPSKPTNNVASSEASYQSIQEKMGETGSLSIEELIVVSEYNTRCSFVDQQHVEKLAHLIQERGFHPKRAVSVNIIKNASGAIAARRVVAGRHRLEAAKLANLSEIPSLLYYDLMPEEEALLDRWDNEMDENHKPVHFLEEAEHYGFLKEIKGWSQIKIAQVKGVSRSATQWKLKIAALPEEVKKFLRGCHKERVPQCGTLAEAHFREICRLTKSCHIILIIKEIIERGQAAEAEEVDERGLQIRALKQQELSSRVDELLKLEAQEKIAPEVAEFVATDEHFLAVTAEHVIPDTPEPSEKKGEQPIVEEVHKVPDEEEALFLKLQKEANEQQRMKGPLGVSSEERSTNWMKFDIVPRWLKWSSLPTELGALWTLLDELIKHEMRYKYMNSPQLSAERYFYINTEEQEPQGTYNYLGLILRLKPPTIEKKIRQLEKWGVLQVQRAAISKYPRFKIHWNHIKQLYDLECWQIPFEEGGLKSIPFDFTGPIEPTPYHTIWIRDGVVKEGMDPKGAEALQGLKQLGASPRLIIKLFKEHTPERLVRQLEELPRQIDRQEQQGRKKEKPLQLFLKGLN